MRPLLLIDVDGVLMPVGRSVPPGYERRTTDEFDVVVRAEHGRWLEQLGAVFDLVWVTTWGDSANRVFGALFDLPPLPVVELGELPRSGTRKLAAVVAHAGRRPLAWIDDELYDDAQQWAAGRGVPTLLVRTAPHVGMTADDLAQLVAFAEALQLTSSD